MNYLPESWLLRQEDKPTNKILSRWLSLCQDKLGADIEVDIAARSEFPELAGYGGELNASVPKTLDGAPFLLLLFEQLDSIEEVLATHEIGHGVLKLQGFGPYLTINTTTRLKRSISIPCLIIQLSTPCSDQSVTILSL